MDNLGWSRRDFLKRSMLAGGLVAAPGLLSACSTTNPETGATTGGGSTLAAIKKAGVVNVGFANEEPYAYQGEGGQLLGEAPAIHGWIFDQIGGIKLQGTLYDFDSLIQALNAGRVDVVTAGMFIEPSRCQAAAFSNPEYIVKTALLVKKGNPMGLSDFDSVAQKGATLAVLSGAVEQDQATAAGVKGSQLQIVSDQVSGLDAVKSGRADALALTRLSLATMAEGDNSVEVTTPFWPVINGEEQIGAGAAVFRKDDTELINAFNAELAKLLADKQKWLSLVSPFGFTAAEFPEPGMTAAQLCKA
jgi:polar amino acid transport system substrate-binding protein